MALILMLFVFSVQADYLLSENELGWDAVSDDAVKFSTGATYQWLTTEVYAVQATDSQVSDGAFSKMTDGLSLAAGGSYGVVSSWDGSYYANAMFDLMGQYSITNIDVSAQFIGVESDVRNRGVGAIEVYVSDSLDEAFTYWAQWEGAYPTADAENETLTVTGDAISARYIQVVFSRKAASDNIWGHKSFHQLGIGEISIYGNVIRVGDEDHWKLLTENVQSGDAVSSKVGKISTEATYEYLTTESYALDSTDSLVLSQDTEFVKLTDGISLLGGGSFGIISTWDGGDGVDVMFDLKSKCLIARAEVSGQFLGIENDSRGRGIGEVQVWTSSSDDPNDPFTYWGQWEGAYPTADSANETLTVYGDLVSARYIQFVLDRHAPSGNSWGHKSFHQLGIGEVSLYGALVANSCEEVISSGNKLSGDLNGDCYVGVDDLNVIALKWLESSEPQGSMSVDAANTIFGAASHMIHTDLFSTEYYDSSWRPENTLPWLVNANLGWVREGLYPSWFVRSDGSLSPRTTELVEKYLTYYQNAGVKVILCPLFGTDIDDRFYGLFDWLAQLADDYECVVAIEMHNEPNLDGFWSGTVQQYVDCCAAAYPIIKAASPDTDVVIGAFSGWGHIWGDTELSCTTGDDECIATKWLVECLDDGILAYCDAISAHPYRSNQTFPEGGIGLESTTSMTGFEDEMYDFWNLIQSYNTTSKSLNLYFTEFGYSSYSTVNNGVGSEEIKADYLSRAMLMTLNARIEGLPIQSIHWYDLKKDNELNVSDYEANFGLVSSDTTVATEAYEFYSRIAKSFNDTTVLSDSSLVVTFAANPSEIKSYTWQDSDGNIIVPFWRASSMSVPGVDFVSSVQVSGFRIR